MYSVLNTLSEYKRLYISKRSTPDTFLLVFKIVKSFQCAIKKFTQSHSSFICECEHDFEKGKHLENILK